VISASIFAALAGLSFALNLWQWLAGRFFPIWQNTISAHPEFLPPLSILKPLKGCDAETRRCLESWFTQSYPGELQLLFGVASPDDPVCELLRELISAHPQTRAELVCTQPILGPNAKVSSLCHLAKHAAYDHLVVSDADVAIGPNFFPELVAPLHEKSVGVVNCFYIQATAHTLPMRLEAIAGNTDFWTHVLQAVSLKPMDFALGAVMAMRRSDLQSIGGFESLLDFLADDFELGRRFAQNGKQLKLSNIPVECRSASYNLREVWEHQVRWARTIRVCRPVGYFFSILGNGTLWPLLALFTAPNGKPIFVAMLLARMLAAVSNDARFTRRCKWWVAALTPLQDIGQALLWFVSFLGNKVVWRGETFRVHKSGKLTRLA
jgi:ceramide glucosyltransferase